MMPANVEEATKDAVIAADNNDRLAGNLSGDVAAGLVQLIRTGNGLPRVREDGF